MNTGSDVPVIAIDGPVGSGKGTIAAQLAAHLGWHLLDSGALYRLVAIAALEAGVDPADEEALAKVARGLDCEFSQADGEVVARLAGVDVRRRLRSNEVSTMASRVAAVAAVREALGERQKAFARPPGLVADGRDMGTVVFPSAVLKIYLTASVEARASRRYKQLKEKGENVNLSRLFRDIEARDRRDMDRDVAPLRPAEDAVVIDSTELGIDEVLEKVTKLVEEVNLTN
jgi:cytidylate kinase